MTHEISIQLHPEENDGGIRIDVVNELGTVVSSGVETIENTHELIDTLIAAVDKLEMLLSDEESVS